MVGEQQMAYPPYFSNNLALLLGFILPLFLVLSFSFIVPPLLKRIVYEKETGVKELMKLMGLPAWMHWVCLGVHRKINFYCQLCSDLLVPELYRHQHHHNHYHGGAGVCGMEARHWGRAGLQ